MKKAVLFILVALMLFAAGCSPAAEPAPAGDTPAPAASGGGQSEAPAAEPANPAPAEARSVNLDIMFPYYGRLQEQIEGYLDQFAEKMLAEKNITVTYDIEYPPDMTLLKTRISSGESPDLFTMHSTLDAPMFEKGGYLADLSGEPFVEKILPSIRTAVDINGKIIGVPLESFTWSYLYNKKIFADNRLTPPQTLSDMKNVIETLKSNNVTPFELAYKEAYFCGWGLQIPLCAMAAKVVPDWYQRMDAGSGSFQELVDKGLLDIFDMINANGTGRPLEIDPDNGVARFASGEAAMLITGPWYSESILSTDPDFQLGLAAFPIDDNPDNTVVMLAVSQVMGCSPSSPNLDVSKAFLNYVLDDQTTSAFYESLQFNQVASNQTLPTHPWTQEGLDIMAKGNYYNEYPLYNSFNDTMGRVAQLYYSGQIDRAGLVAEMDAAWAKAVAEQ